jgi:hypothetical protein
MLRHARNFKCILLSKGSQSEKSHAVRSHICDILVKVIYGEKKSSVSRGPWEGRKDE